MNEFFKLFHSTPPLPVLMNKRKEYETKQLLKKRDSNDNQEYKIKERKYEEELNKFTWKSALMIKEGILKLVYQFQSSCGCGWWVKHSIYHVCFILQDLHFTISIFTYCLSNVLLNESIMFAGNTGYSSDLHTPSLHNCLLQPQNLRARPGVSTWSPQAPSPPR